jgi:nucleoside-diphosphate-sugar epimerase
VECIQADLSDADAVTAATAGCDAVIHTAAKAGVWGDFQDYFDANVTGTRNVILACKAHAVPKLVYTSTPSVTFAGEDEDGVDESMPYAENFLCHYAATKALAERDVLAANGGTLSTVALRPHLIWGPGDHHLVPRVIARAKAGKLKLVGNGKNRVDATYIDNAAEAHLCALDVLTPEATCAGKAYYISNDEPIPMGTLLNRILEAGGLPPVSRSVPPVVAYFAGATLEKVYGALRKKEEPIMTRFVARQLATAHWFNISGAKRDLGYRPSVNMDEGMRRLAKWLKARPHRPD